MLSREQMRAFDDEGYLVVEDVLDSETVIEPVVAEYEAILDCLFATWIADGSIEEPATHATFEDKIIQAYRAGCEYFQPMDISLPGGEVEADTPFHAGPAIFRLMTDPFGEVLETL